MPQKPRPEMSVHVARNLLVAALGIKPKISKEQRAQEHLKISKARGKSHQSLKLHTSYGLILHFLKFYRKEEG